MGTLTPQCKLHPYIALRTLYTAFLSVNWPFCTLQLGVDVTASSESTMT